MLALGLQSRSFSFIALLHCCFLREQRAAFTSTIRHKDSQSPSKRITIYRSIFRQSSDALAHLISVGGGVWWLVCGGPSSGCFVPSFSTLIFAASLCSFRPLALHSRPAQPPHACLRTGRGMFSRNRPVSTTRSPSSHQSRSRNPRYYTPTPHTTHSQADTHGAPAQATTINMAITLVDEMHAHPWERYVSGAVFLRPGCSFLQERGLTPTTSPTGTVRLSAASSPSSSLASLF